MQLERKAFQTTHDGKQTDLFTLTNHNGMLVQITNYGAKIASIIVADQDGKKDDVVLGYKTIQEYINGNPYFGAICGRYANRIASGIFKIDDQSYNLALNNGVNHLHGGINGFNNVVWDVVKESSNSVELHYLSRDLEESYPGNLDVYVNYRLSEENELIIEYKATTDKKTFINLTSHSFFNLSGESSGSILNHHLRINSTHFTPVSDSLIPTGEIKAVADTPMDFTQLTKIGERIDDNYDQLNYGKGYDHNWVLNKPLGELGPAATVFDPQSGRIMEVLTTEPGMQCYTGNWLDGSDKGKTGKAYGMREAFCLETQHYPDSPNQPNFPTTLLNPQETYKQICVYKFSTTRD